MVAGQELTHGVLVIHRISCM